MISKTRKFSYLLLLVLSITSWWLLKLNGIEDDKIAVPAHSPDFFSLHYTKWEMDESGLLKKKIMADKIEHFGDDGSTHLQKPVIGFHNKQSVSWTIQSEAGMLSDDGNNVQMLGEVVIERGKSDKQHPLKIITSNLNVKPETNHAETQERAEIILPPNVTTGLGMKIFFAEPFKLELLANVKGKYEKQ